MLFGGSLVNQFINWEHDEISPGSGDHEGIMNSTLGNFNLNIGLNDKWNLAVDAMAGVRQMDFKGIENIHHRDESKTGLGDVRIILRHLVSNETFGPGKRMFLGYGVVIPSGNSLPENPFALGSLGKEHTHFDMSEGVYKILGEVQYFKRGESPLVFGGVGKLEVPLFPNKYGYLTGSQLNTTIMGYLQSRRILKGMPLFTISGQYRTSDYWNGEKAPNSGGSVVQLGGGLVWNMNGSMVTMSFRVPVLFTTNMVGEGASDIDSKTSVWGVSLSFRKVFDFHKFWPEEKDEDGHDHAH